MSTWLPGAMVARLASIADGTKRLQVRVLRWSLFPVFISSDGRIHLILTKSGNTHNNAITSELNGQNEIFLLYMQEHYAMSEYLKSL